MFDGDEGPNTGGMGAYSPMPGLSSVQIDELMDVAVHPTLAALRAHGIDYRGLLYAGLMLTAQGPKVIEFNVRFGDPEAQVVLPRVTSDLFEVFRQAAAGALVDAPTFSEAAAVTIVSGGRSSRPPAVNRALRTPRSSSSSPASSSASLAQSRSVSRGGRGLSVAGQQGPPGATSAAERSVTAPARPHPPPPPPTLSEGIELAAMASRGTERPRGALPSGDPWRWRRPV